MQSGTLISCLFTQEDIYLFSDGRTLNRENGEINNEHTKVLGISKYCGLLVAGVYLPELARNVSIIVSENKLIYVDDISNAVQFVLKKTWEYIEKENPPEKVKASRLFVFICGFDKFLKPRLFYVDNMTNPKFEIKERILFTSSTEIEIAAISAESGNAENLTQMLSDNIKKYYNKKANLGEIFSKSFDDVKEELSKTYKSIGGKTFFSKINKYEGYIKIK